jgi:hypothetical protein
MVMIDGFMASKGKPAEKWQAGEGFNLDPGSPLWF